MPAPKSIRAIGTALSAKAVGSLHEFGRYVNDLEYRARHTVGAEAARPMLMEWLGELGFEQHLLDSEENPKVAAARWSNVLDFIDWIARRCGGEIAEDGSGQVQTETKSVLDVAQTISVILSLAERGEADQNVVTLSTLHASKGLEWPHVVLVGVNEGTLPFKREEEEMTVERLEEERRLMYVGITRARRTLLVTTLLRQKRGREVRRAFPSRFIKEMRLDEQVAKVNPRDRIAAQRAAFAARAAAQGGASG